jgi:hypothetical protein
MLHHPSGVSLLAKDPDATPFDPDEPVVLSPAAKPKRRTPAETRIVLLKCAQLIAAGRHPPHVFGRYGLNYGRVWRWLKLHDTDGSVAAMIDDARRWAAHSHADRAISVLRRGRQAMSVPDAIMAGHLAKSHQWSAERLNPDRYGKGSEAPPPAQVVHHVVHFPDRGPQPDARSLPALGTLELPSGLLPDAGVPARNPTDEVEA